MRNILMITTLFLLLSTTLRGASPVTTAPSVSEVQQLRALVKSLQAENEMLRAQVSALSAGNPAAPVTSRALPDSTDTPLAGVDAIFQGFPKDQMPGPDDAADGLRHSLMRKWVHEAAGKRISLRARFGEASGITNGHFTVRVGTGPIPQSSHPFEATIVMPESEAPTALRFRRGSGVQVTGRIKSIDVPRTGDGFFVVVMELDLASIITDGR